MYPYKCCFLGKAVRQCVMCVPVSVVVCECASVPVSADMCKCARGPVPLRFREYRVQMTCRQSPHTS